LIEEIIVFQHLMLQYKKNKNNEIELKKIEEKIIFAISNYSILTSFKRQEIKNQPKYHNFKHYFE